MPQPTQAPAPPNLPDDQHVDDERPPFLGSWSRVYALVVGSLLLMLGLLYWLSVAFTA